MRSQARMWQSYGRTPVVAGARAVTLLLTLAATLVMAGCSTSGGSSGINFTLGLQGSTADNPAQPPKIGANGPDGEYAFVYDNQVWAHVKGAANAVQVTRLTLSNGATIEWGPLVWSPSGKSLAFSLVENMATDQPMRSDGPIYYVNLSNCLTTAGASCPVYVTEATGSVYGHSYAWFNDDWLIAGSGGGMLAFDISDPNGWRTWQLRSTTNEQQDYNCGQPRAYGDVQVVGSTLYYSCLGLSTLDATGVVGSATLNSANLSQFANDFTLDQVTRDEQIASTLNNDSLYGSQVASLGNAYQDAKGAIVAGAWRVSNTTLVYEQVGKVDTQHATVARTVCETSVYTGNCSQTPLSGVSSQPLSAHPQLSIGPNGSVAYQGDALYLSTENGSTAVSSPYPATWISNTSVAATKTLSTNTDASGVTRTSANLVIAQGGSSTTLIAGASDIVVR